jgi:hypothetical protein
MKALANGGEGMNSAGQDPDLAITNGSNTIDGGMDQNAAMAQNSAGTPSQQNSAAAQGNMAAAQESEPTGTNAAIAPAADTTAQNAALPGGSDAPASQEVTSMASEEAPAATDVAEESASIASGATSQTAGTAASAAVSAPALGGIVMYVLPGGAPVYDQPAGTVVGQLEQGDHPLVWVTK